MATYKVTDPNTGKTLKLTGDSPPTEAELEDIFSSIGSTNEQPKAQPEQERTPLRGDSISDVAMGALGVGPVSRDLLRRSLGGVVSDVSSVNPERALLTNEPTQGVTESLLRSVPAVGGSILGGAGGAVAGLGVGAIPGAGIGAASGEAVRQGLVSARNAYRGVEGSTPREVLSEVGIQGALGAGGAALAEGASIAYNKLRPAATRLGAQLLKSGPGVPEKYGQAFIENPNIVANAPTQKEINAGYRAFEEANGLISPRVARAKSGNLIQKTGKAEELINDVYTRLANGEQVAKQELYEASQSARFLKDQARFGDPNQLSNLSNINEAKSLIDDSLESVASGYRELRANVFARKTADQFSSFLPLNKNQSPNVLRTLGVGSAAIGSAIATANPLLLAPLAAISPKLSGLAIRGAHGLAGSVKIPLEALARYGPMSLQNYYRSPGNK